MNLLKKDRSADRGMKGRTPLNPSAGSFARRAGE